MKYVALTLVALLATANVSLAAMSISVSGPVDLDDPNDVLVAYTVTAYGATGWADLVIMDGIGQELLPVHQCAPSWNLNTAWDKTLMNYGAAAIVPYDTHLIEPPGVSKLTDVNVETNSGSNPGGLAAVGPVDTFGMGTFDARGTAFYVLDSTPEPSYDIMNIVCRKDQMWFLYGTMADSSGNETSFVIFTPLIPEPGTLMVLLTGVLCLLGIRRR